ncbi:hypothetical protein H0H92_002505 [Tricholoma furcatifolium]|nr:hypothetical protein H0H92_002505 [Tricholoma furcatifolium]
MSAKDYVLSSTVPWFIPKADSIEQQMTTVLRRKLKDQNAKIVWRNNDISLDGGIRRWDRRGPDTVFEKGFTLRDEFPESKGLTDKSVDIEEYINMHHDPSVFVSTAQPYREGGQVKRWQPDNLKDWYEYTIFAYGGIDANATLGDNPDVNPFPFQHEVSFVGGNRREFIYSARQYDRNGTLIRIWRNNTFDVTANEQFQVPVSKLPPFTPVPNVQLTTWKSAGVYEGYTKLPTDPPSFHAINLASAHVGHHAPVSFMVTSAATSKAVSSSGHEHLEEAMKEKGEITVDTLM